MNELTYEQVKDYYGKVLETKNDLKTSACCTAEAMPSHLRPILSQIHDEIKDKFYGCGSPIPSELEGKTVLDLGSGTGRDCFILSKLVGPNGKVIGVDMTDEQLEVARKHTAYHMEKFGYSKPNVEFHHGYIEDLESLGIQNESIDVVVSNCVLNLSPHKQKVFSEIMRVLKKGGELYFSDVFSTSRIPQPLTKDPVLLGECLGGALYIEDFRRMLSELGCKDYRLVSRSKIDLIDKEVIAKIGHIEFYSMTIRAFKLDCEDRCEDYGQVARYLGTIKESPHTFMLDDHHYFQKLKAYPVCSNTAMMLSDTRFSKHFEIIGDTSTHFGLFDCATPSQSIDASIDAMSNSNLGACC